MAPFPHSTTALWFMGREFRSSSLDGAWVVLTSGADDEAMIASIMAGAAGDARHHRHLKATRNWKMATEGGGRHSPSTFVWEEKGVPISC